MQSISARALKNSEHTGRRVSFTTIADMRRFLRVPMTTRAPQNLRVRKFLFAVLLIVIIAAIGWTILQNRPWTVPDEARLRANPLTSSDATLQSVRPLYHEKCASCHGESGKGDGHDATLYDPAPTNFTDTKRMTAVTDGELFYKLSQGRKPMPSFKKRLTEDQLWRLVLLLRSFAGAPAGSSAATPGNLGTSNPQQ